MPLVSLSFLFTSIAITAAWLYITRRNSSANVSALPSLHPFLSAIVLLHSLFILHSAIVCPPANLFNRLNVPLTTSVERIRFLLVREAGIATDTAGAATIQLPKGIEYLLNKLNSAESRMLYTRFGQRAIQTCQHCSSSADYALFALPRPLLAYIRSAAVISFVTTRGMGKERWRTYALTALLCAALVEAYMVVIASATVPIPRDGRGAIMWHDIIFLCRHVLFFILPIITIILPSSSTFGGPLAFLPPALMNLEQAITRAHLLKYVRGSVMRRAELRERASRWWSRDAREGSWGRNDENVQRTAEKLGLGYGPFGNEDGVGEGIAEGKLKMGARMAV
ncbi:hypothetical protein SERLA73DRAFT_99156, partial [Serpula lacrymans var. lacrymans S7.3]